MAVILAVNASACTPAPRLGPERQDPGWPYYLGTPSHDVSARESLPVEPPPRRVWLAQTGQAVRGAPAIGPDVVAVTSTDRYLTLLERTNGKVFWRTHLDGTLAAGPLLRGDRLFVATEAAPDARAYALRLANGKPIWKVDVKGGVAAPLVLDGGDVLLGTEPGTVWALDAQTGDVRWRSKLNGAIRAQPLITPQGVLVFTTDDSMFLLHRGDGKVLERRPTPGGGTVLGTPALDSATAYLATTAGEVVALDLATLAPRWTVSAGDVVYGAPALARDTLFVMARSGVLLSIPVAAPAQVRRDSLLPAATAGPTPLADGVLVAGVDGTVLLARSNGGGAAAIAWRIQVPGPVESPPIVRDATLLVVGGHGDVHLFR